MIKIYKYTYTLFFFYSFNNYTSSISPEQRQSGIDAIKAIMLNERTGIIAQNFIKKDNFAETKSIEEDLKLEKITEYFNCKTEMGKIFLLEALKKPLNTQDKDALIQKRQQFIKKLIENPIFKKEIEQLIVTIKENEDALVELFSEYFEGKSCGKELREMREIESLEIKALTKTVKFLNRNSALKTLEYLFKATILTAENAASLAYSYISITNPGNVSLNYIVTPILWLVTGFSNYGAYTIYSTAEDERHKIHSLREIILQSRALEIIKNDQNLATQQTTHIHNQHDPKLINDIQGSRYKPKKSWFFIYPLAHNSLINIYENKEVFTKIFNFIGEIDAYNAIADTVIASQNSNNQFCFVDFINAEKPMFDVVDSWNVLVRNAVPNSLSEDKNIILTGPNAGGKTTYSMTVLQNIVLGQAFGIAAAKKFNFTQFDAIHSYLNVNDDIIKGESLFQAEVNRAKEILEKIKTLNPKRKFFFTLDELFTGTNAEDGQELAQKYIKALSAYKNIQYIYATHYDAVKKFAHQNSASFSNYTVGSPFERDNKFTYPYTVTKGYGHNARVGIKIAEMAGLFDTPLENPSWFKRITMRKSFKNKTSIRQRMAEEPGEFYFNTPKDDAKIKSVA